MSTLYKDFHICTYMYVYLYTNVYMPIFKHMYSYIYKDMIFSVSIEHLVIIIINILI